MLINNSHQAIFVFAGLKLAPVGVISHIDILRAANLLIEQHGDEAAAEAERISALMGERGDQEGRLHWYLIRRAVEWLHVSQSSARH